MEYQKRNKQKELDKILAKKRLSEENKKYRKNLSNVKSNLKIIVKVGKKSKKKENEEI